MILEVKKFLQAFALSSCSSIRRPDTVAYQFLLLLHLTSHVQRVAQIGFGEASESRRTFASNSLWDIRNACCEWLSSQRQRVQSSMWPEVPLKERLKSWIALLWGKHLYLRASAALGIASRKSSCWSLIRTKVLRECGWRRQITPYFKIFVDAVLSILTRVIA
jgi:hypothetical protein